MKSKATISSSSFLAPTNPVWRKIRDDIQFEFAAYGDFMSVYDRPPEVGIGVSVLFIEDILQDPSDLANKLQNILANVAAFLKQNRNTAIFAFACKPFTDVVRNAQKMDALRQPLWDFENGLYALSHNYPNFYTLNLDPLFSKIGYSKCYDNRNWYSYHMRVSKTGLDAVVGGIVQILDRINSGASKVLVLDCDNTLWGGVIGEDGVEGLMLGTDGIGQAFADFQNNALRISHEGVVLCLASKNVEHDVWDVFDNHPEMKIARSDITCAKINWQEKHISIAEIASELDLGLESFVFWDDNPLERELVKNQLPDVHVVDVPKEVTEWPDFLSGLSVFSRFNVTDEDARKTEQYQTRALFVEGQKGHVDKAEFLKTIDARPVLALVDKFTLARASQMTIKTNQFNLRTARYTLDEMSRFIEIPGQQTYVAGLSDRFGDHGNVGLAMVRNLGEGIVFLENYLLSCRVLGRDFEFWVLGKLCENLAAQNIQKLILEYVPTDRNILIKDFLKSCALKEVENVGELSVEMRAGSRFFEMDPRNSIANFDGIYEDAGDA
jgi:FkbH-like protein